jgi:leucyl aminopeptidase
VWYADTQLKATSIVDIATLTGAASIALGDFVSGVVANNQALCDKVLAAGKESGEKCWPMPCGAEFEEYNKSEVADIKNSGGRSGGMITGGLFIGAFTQKPWVHIDIGNTVVAKKTDGYNVKGPTGFGVRLLVELTKQLVLCW